MMGPQYREWHDINIFTVPLNVIAEIEP